MSRFIKAEAGLNHTIIYTDESGKYFRYSGGTWAWRNNNPGNLYPDGICKRHNQIGRTKHFAIFPDYENGHLALIDCLKTTYKNSAIPELVQNFAPEKDGNNVKVYIKFLLDKTGVSDDKKVKEFSSSAFEKLWRAVEQMEGYKKGTIVEVFPITQVHKNKTGIYNYHVKNKGWISKSECITLVKQGKLDLVICTSRLENDFLRARAGSSVNESLEHMVVKNKAKGK